MTMFPDNKFHIREGRLKEWLNNNVMLSLTKRP